MLWYNKTIILIGGIIKWKIDFIAKTSFDIIVVSEYGDFTVTLNKTKYKYGETLDFIAKMEYDDGTIKDVTFMRL